jgi:hypothetical protein
MSKSGNFDLAYFAVQNIDYASPSPYCLEDLRFLAEKMSLTEGEIYSTRPSLYVGIMKSY